MASRIKFHRLTPENDTRRTGDRFGYGVRALVLGVGLWVCGIGKYIFDLTAIQHPFLTFLAGWGCFFCWFSRDEYDFYALIIYGYG